MHWNEENLLKRKEGKKMSEAEKIVEVFKMYGYEATISAVSKFLEEIDKRRKLMGYEQKLKEYFKRYQID